MGISTYIEHYVCTCIRRCMYLTIVIIKTQEPTHKVKPLHWTTDIDSHGCGRVLFFKQIISCTGINYTYPTN